MTDSPADEDALVPATVERQQGELYLKLVLDGIELAATAAADNRRSLEEWVENRHREIRESNLRKPLKKWLLRLEPEDFARLEGTMNGRRGRFLGKQPFAPARKGLRTRRPLAEYEMQVPWWKAFGDRRGVPFGPITPEEHAERMRREEEQERRKEAEWVRIIARQKKQRLEEEKRQYQAKLARDKRFRALETAKALVPGMVAKLGRVLTVDELEALDPLLVTHEHCSCAKYGGVIDGRWCEICGGETMVRVPAIRMKVPVAEEESAP